MVNDLDPQVEPGLFYSFLGTQTALYLAILGFVLYNSIKYVFSSKTGIVKSNAIRLFYITMGLLSFLRAA
jgi:hypothetical protein